MVAGVAVPVEGVDEPPVQTAIDLRGIGVAEVSSDAHMAVLVEMFPMRAAPILDQTVGRQYIFLKEPE